MLTLMEIENSPNPIAILEAAERELAEVKDFHAILDIREVAEIIRSHAETRKQSLALQNRAAKVRIQAEREIGRSLLSLKLRGGNRKSDSDRQRLNLKDLGIDRNASSLWQKIAAASDEEFESYCQATEAAGRAISTKGFLRFLRKKNPKKGKRRGKKHKSSTTATSPSAGKLPQIEDALGHLEILTRMFDEIILRFSEQLKPVERRSIPRYLKEMRAFLQGTNSESWADGDPSS
jgi:hypothetical protein